MGRVTLPDPKVIKAAKGEVEVDLILAGGQLVDVLAGVVRETPVAIHQGLIVGMQER